MITKIKECEYCGQESDDIDGGLRGHGDYCISCGAGDRCWDVACVCGNEFIWDEYGEYIMPECYICKVHVNDFQVTHIDSAYIINTILKRPDLHKERTMIPVSFVETLIDYIDNQER